MASSRCLRTGSGVSAIRDRDDIREAFLALGRCLICRRKLKNSS
jgi:hypothetical protein